MFVGCLRFLEATYKRFKYELFTASSVSNLCSRTVQHCEFNVTVTPRFDLGYLVYPN